MSCLTPENTNGYIVNEINPSSVQGLFDVNVSCAEGYEEDSNGAMATLCNSPGEPYILSGCTRECPPPVSTDIVNIYINHVNYPQCIGNDDGSGTEATCTGDNDGSGNACTLNGDSTACEVQEGNCVFNARTPGSACALNAIGDGCEVDDGDCIYIPRPTESIDNDFILWNQNSSNNIFTNESPSELVTSILSQNNYDETKGRYLNWIEKLKVHMQTLVDDPDQDISQSNIDDLPIPEKCAEIPNLPVPNDLPGESENKFWGTRGYLLDEDKGGVSSFDMHKFYKTYDRTRMREQAAGDDLTNATQRLGCSQSDIDEGICPSDEEIRLDRDTAIAVANEYPLIPLKRFHTKNISRFEDLGTQGIDTSQYQNAYGRGEEWLFDQYDLGNVKSGQGSQQSGSPSYNPQHEDYLLSNSRDQYSHGSNSYDFLMQTPKVPKPGYSGSDPNDFTLFEDILTHPAAQNATTAGGMSVRVGRKTYLPSIEVDGVSVSHPSHIYRDPVSGVEDPNSEKKLIHRTETCYPEHYNYTINLIAEKHTRDFFDIQYLHVPKMGSNHYATTDTLTNGAGSQSFVHFNDDGGPDGHSVLDDRFSNYSLPVLSRRQDERTDPFGMPISPWKINNAGRDHPNFRGMAVRSGSGSDFSGSLVGSNLSTNPDQTLDSHACIAGTGDTRSYVSANHVFPSGNTPAQRSGAGGGWDFIDRPDSRRISGELSVEADGTGERNNSMNRTGVTCPNYATIYESIYRFYYDLIDDNYKRYIRPFTKQRIDWKTKAIEWMVANPCDTSEEGTCWKPDDLLNSDGTINHSNYFKLDPRIEQEKQTNSLGEDFDYFITLKYPNEDYRYLNNDDLTSLTSYQTWLNDNISTCSCPENHIPIHNTDGSIVCEECSDDEFSPSLSRSIQDVTCQSLRCDANYKPQNHQCIECEEDEDSDGVTCNILDTIEGQYISNHDALNCSDTYGGDSVYNNSVPPNGDNLNPCECNENNYLDNNSMCISCPLGTERTERSPVTGNATYCDNLESANDEIDIHYCNGIIVNNCNSHETCTSNNNDCSYTHESRRDYFYRFISEPGTGNNQIPTKCNDILGISYGSTARCTNELTDDGNVVTSFNQSLFDQRSDPSDIITNTIINSGECRDGYVTSTDSCYIKPYNREYINIEPFMYENNTYTIREHNKPIKQEITLDGVQVMIEYVDLRTLSQRSNFGYLTSLTDFRYTVGDNQYSFTSNLTDEEILAILSEQNTLLTGSNVGNVLNISEWPDALTHNLTLLYFIDSRDGAIHCPHPLLTGDPDTSNTGGDTTKYFFSNKDATGGEIDNGNYTCKLRTTTCTDGSNPTDNSIVDYSDNTCGLIHTDYDNCFITGGVSNLSSAFRTIINTEINQNTFENTNQIFPITRFDTTNNNFTSGSDRCILSNGSCPINQYRECSIDPQNLGEIQCENNPDTPGLECGFLVSHGITICPSDCTSIVAGTVLNEATCEGTIPGQPATCTELATATGGDSVPADAALCQAVTELGDSTACDAVMKADGTDTACTYTEATLQRECSLNGNRSACDNDPGGNCIFTASVVASEDICGIPGETYKNCSERTIDSCEQDDSCRLTNINQSCNSTINCIECGFSNLPQDIRDHIGEKSGNYKDTSELNVNCSNNIGTPEEGFSPPENGVLLVGSCNDGFYLNDENKCVEIQCNYPTYLPGEQNSGQEDIGITNSQLSIDRTSDIPFSTFDSSPKQCNEGYHGSITQTCGPSSGSENINFSGSCTLNECVSPTNQTGYILMETSKIQNTFDVSVECESGYEGTPVTESCNSHNSEYTISGCQEIICTRPSDTAGYVITDDDESTLTQNGFSVTPQCAEGYEGTPSATACTTSGPYTLGGCQEITCTRPSDTAGYIITDDNESTLTKNGFSVTPQCDTGYEGTPVATACTTSGEYTLSGCIEVSGPTELEPTESETTQSCAATCTETATTSVQADADACAAVTNLTDSNECGTVMTAADSSIPACTYTASTGSPTCSLPSCGAPNADGTCPTGCILGTGGTWTAPTDATCTGADDGTGTACSLNGDSTACAVQGGDCTFTAAIVGSCSDGTSTDQATCEGSGSSCTVDPSLSCTLTTDGECPTGCIFSCEAPSAQEESSVEETPSLGECTSLLGSEIISTDESLSAGTHHEENLSIGAFDVSLGCNLETHIGLPRITPCSEPGTPYTIDSNYCIPLDNSSEETEVAIEDYTLEIQSKVVFAGDPPAEGSAEEEFKENFINALLTQFPNLTRSNITINGIKAGSTIVDYTISYPVNEGETPPSQEALQTVIQQADFTTLGYGAPTSVTVTKQAAPTRGYLFLGISFMVCLSVIALIVILMTKKKSE